MSHLFFLGRCPFELARRSSRVAPALHGAGSSTPFWVTIDVRKVLLSTHQFQSRQLLFTRIYPNHTTLIGHSLGQNHRTRMSTAPHYMDGLAGFSHAQQSTDVLNSKANRIILVMTPGTHAERSGRMRRCMQTPSQWCRGNKSIAWNRRRAAQSKHSISIWRKATHALVQDRTGPNAICPCAKQPLDALKPSPWPRRALSERSSMNLRG